MKRILKNILCLALVSSAVFASCNKSDVVEVPDFRLSPYEDKTQVLLALGQDLQYTVESEFFQYSKTADEANEILAAPAFLINSNCSWRIEPVDGAVSWCHPFPEEGDKDGRMFFRLDRNNDQENDRSAYYKFVLNDGSKDIEVGGFIIVHQNKAVDFLKLAPADKVEVSVNGSKNVKITVTSNVPWTYELTPMEDYATPDLEWITDKTEIVEGAVTNTILLSVADNNGGTIRGANVVIKVPGNEDLNQIMPLTQYGDEATIEGFPVQWKASAGDAYYSKWPSSSNTIPTIDADNGSGTICFYRADVPGLNRTKSTCDASGSNPRVNGAWPGDYFEFTADAPVSAGSLIKIQFEARISGSGCRHWRLEYLDGNDWKIAGTLRTLVAPDGTEVRYTQDMYPGGSADDYNKIISQVVKYENTTMEAKFRWYVASNIIAKDGTQMTAPTEASARLDCSKAENEPCISCVAAGSEVILSGEITCSEDLLTFEGTPEGPKTITVNATQDYTVVSKSEWLHIDVMSGYANEEKTVSVTCDPSDLSVLRKGEIEIRSGANKKSITVVQSAAGGQLDPLISVTADKNTSNLLGEGDNFSVTVQSNIEYSVETSADWITEVEVPQTKGLVEKSYRSFTLFPNVTGAARSGYVRFYNTDNGVEAYVMLKQENFEPNITLTLQSDQLRFIPAAGAKIPVHIYANIDFAVTSDEVILPVSEAKAGSYDIEVEVKENTGLSRDARVTFRNDKYDYTYVFAIDQHGTDVIFADNFDWLSPVIEKAKESTPGDYDTVGNKNLSAKAPNIYTDDALNKIFVPLRDAIGYYIPGKDDGANNVVYPQENYLKMGKTKTESQTSLTLPALDPSGKDMEISFDWARMVQGSGAIDNYTLTLMIVGNGTFENGTKYSEEFSTPQKTNEIFWTNFSATVKGADKDTRITMVATSNLDKSTGKIDYKQKGGKRMFIDNIVVKVK